MTYLLDLNILIALGDTSHQSFGRVRSWFLSADCDASATCPLTENGIVRILGQPNYTGFTGGVEDARQALQAIKSFPGHQFWPDDLSLTDIAAFPELSNAQHLTDIYLLGLAISKQGKLAALDARIDPSGIPGGAQAYTLIL